MSNAKHIRKLLESLTEISDFGAPTTQKFQIAVFYTSSNGYDDNDPGYDPVAYMSKKEQSILTREDFDVAGVTSLEQALDAVNDVMTGHSARSQSSYSVQSVDSVSKPFVGDYRNMASAWAMREGFTRYSGDNPLTTAGAVFYKAL